MKTIQQLAQDAVDVQDACNLSGVLHSFFQVVCELREHTDLAPYTVRNHPIVQAWADKVASLTGTQGNIDAALNAHRWCAEHSA